METQHGHHSPNGDKSHRRPQRATGHGRRFRGLTCAKCRARKVRCDGGQPECKTCEIYGVSCRYDKAPSMSQVLHLAKQLDEAEKTISELQRNAAGNRSASSSSPTLHDQAILPDRDAAFPALSLSDNISSDTTILPHAPTAPTPTNRPPDLSLDDQGKISYYGPTSAVHEPSRAEADESPAASGSVGRSQGGGWSFVPSQTSESTLWEEYALGNAVSRTRIPREVLGKLLHLHWTWVAPMFMWVYRPAFLRDMTTGGRYYSELLLTVLCAHSAKYVDEQCVHLLNSRVKVLLSDAIHEPSSIPTVQALLQLSARELANGSLSQGWLYSGMAFRMADDLLLQHHSLDVSNVKGVSAVDLEVRRRLAWSCYFWDKAISLYTGRLPAVTEVPPLATLNCLDSSTDAEAWCPYYGDTMSLTSIAPLQFPYMKSHTVSCFVNSCKLSIIIGDVIERLYSRQSKNIMEAALKTLQTRLNEWRAQSPTHLKCDPDNLPETCMPPHIISQNMLYFATVILAHRPFWFVSSHYQRCINTARNMEKLLLLFESTYRFDNISYLMGYCIYTGASAMLEHAKKGDEEANRTMRTFLRALHTGSRRCPLLERSLGIILRGLKPDGIQHPIEANHQVTSSYIPAFPQSENHGPPNMPGLEDLGEPGFSGFSGITFLDCYPEMQLNLGEFMPQT